ncbi:MAG TPA: hypothetical protein VFV87_20275 [Pirellulaceae bacterium]|nr:hypothetical protein [Pirellulaceae bacterium]
MLTSTVVSFRWQPPAGGHRWVQAHPVTDNWAVTREKVEVLAPFGFPMFWETYGKPEAAYESLETASGLFRELAALDAGPEAILAFANKYGPLTPGRLFVLVGNHGKFPRPPLPRSHTQEPVRPLNTGGRGDEPEWTAKWLTSGAVAGDSLAFWHQHIRAMRALVGLWDALQGRDRAAIEEVARFTWQGKKRAVGLVDERGNSLGESIRFDQASSASLTLQRAAEHALIRALAGFTSDGASIRLFPPDSRHQRRLAIVPRSLIDAIWLQFALAVLENKTYRECEVCGKPFEISPQVARTSRTLCSAACKARAHRQRRDQALKLANQGVAPRQIAKRVGSQLSTVQNWLSEAKEK